MVQRLNQDQLGQIVAEVVLLQQRQEAELDLEQVKQILQELNLPPTGNWLLRMFTGDRPLSDAEFQVK